MSKKNNVQVPSIPRTEFTYLVIMKALNSILVLVPKIFSKLEI